jgi:hypothetical protein
MPLRILASTGVKEARSMLSLKPKSVQTLEVSWPPYVCMCHSGARLQVKVTKMY